MVGFISCISVKLKLFTGITVELVLQRIKNSQWRLLGLLIFYSRSVNKTGSPARAAQQTKLVQAGGYKKKKGWIEILPRLKSNIL
jgi:hypothetical protein